MKWTRIFILNLIFILSSVIISLGQSSEISLSLSFVNCFNKFAPDSNRHPSVRHNAMIFYEYGLEYLHQSKNDKLLYYGAIKLVASGTSIVQEREVMFQQQTLLTERGAAEYENDDLALQFGLGKTLKRKNGKNKIDIIGGASIRILYRNNSGILSTGGCARNDCFIPLIHTDEYYHKSKFHLSLFSRLSWVMLQNKKASYNIRLNMVGAYGLKPTYQSTSILEHPDGKTYTFLSQFSGTYAGLGISLSWLKGWQTFKFWN